MTSYIANHQKKRQALARRELDLARAVRRGKGDAVLLAAAEEVRLARTRVLRVELSLIPPCEKYAYTTQLAEEQIRRSEATSADEIMAEFRGLLRKGRAK